MMMGPCFVSLDTQMTGVTPTRLTHHSIVRLVFRGSMLSF